MMAKTPNHMAGIDSLPKWDPSNLAAGYRYVPGSYDPADYQQFKQARLAAQAKQKQPTNADLSKSLSKQISQAIASKAPQVRKKRHSGDLDADTSDSMCFDDLFYSASDGGVWASFIGPTAGYWFYPLTRAEAETWFSDDLGRYFNDAIR